MKTAGSLRSRLLAGMLAAVTLIWLGVVVAAYREARDEVGEVLDAHLVQFATLLAGQAEIEDGELEVDGPVRHRYQQEVAFQIWDSRRLIARSASAPEARLSPHDEGFSAPADVRQAWRVFSLRHRDLTIQVAERLDSREGVGREIIEHLLLPMLVALPLLGIALAYAIRQGLRPLNALVAELAVRSPEGLEPLADTSAPSELRPVVERLNALFGQIRETIARERRFTADASHELRTPIAAIRAQAEVALGSQDAGERNRALDQVIKGCDRTTHLTEQLLMLARLDLRSQEDKTAVDLAAVAASVLSDCGPWAHERGVAVQLEAEGPAIVQGNGPLLGVLLRNLVDNAVRYSPKGSIVTVRIRTKEGTTALEIVDRGPGIPPHERTEVLQRFHRLDSLQEGSGLGLSIVARIAELHGAHLSLSEAEPAPGLCVTVAFCQGLQSQ